MRSLTRAAHARCARLKRVYGITCEQHQQMWNQQDGRCAICRREFGEKRRNYVDHDHSTHRVRGLLCFTCNRYKVAKNDALSAQAVAAYLLSDFDGRRL